MNVVKYVVSFLIIAALICSCVPTEPSATQTALPLATKTSIPTATIASIVSAPTTLRIKLTTTSDWTDLYIHSDVVWAWQGVISRSKEAGNARIDSDHLVLDQPISRAEAGESVELVANVGFRAWKNENVIRFQINRGNIGYTTVELLRQVDNEWTTLKTITWSGINEKDEFNSYVVELSAEALLSENPVIAPVNQPAQEAAPSLPITGMPEGTDGYPWWNDTIFYEIFVRSFYDSNGDGIGDLNGITQKLDYLNDGNPSTNDDLGVTGIWLMPITVSPSYHGYAVTDYYAIDPEYGTMDDFKTLLDEAHARGLRVIIDLVMNHTSNQHPWFVSASGSPTSPYRNWYIWSATDPGYLGSWGQQVWFPSDGAYYYSLMTAGMPDLNYTNPEVKAEMKNVARFWLEEVGVDGFRLDAAKHIIEEGQTQINTPSTHAWWKEFRTVYKQSNPEAMAVAEIWEPTDINAKYVQGDELDLSFEFDLSFRFIDAVKNGDSSPAYEQLELSYTEIPSQSFATFLTNHDLDRIMTRLDYDPEKAKAAASLLLTSPGTPFIYYGDEIGMQGEYYEPARSPMQWATGLNAGFSIVNPWEGLGTGWQYTNISVEAEKPTSLLNHYRALIQARNEHSALRVGDLSLVETGNPGLYAILRASDEETVLVLINLTGGTITDYALSLTNSPLSAENLTPRLIMGQGSIAPLQTGSNGGFSNYIPVSEIPPYTTFILQLKS